MHEQQQHQAPQTTRFLNFVAANYPAPQDALGDFFDDAVAAAALVDALLEELPVLDGRRHYLPNPSGKRDQRQFYIGSLRTDSDGTTWPTITFKTFRHGGHTIYWCPRDLAWQQFRACPDAGADRREAYLAKAEAARANARAKAAESEQQAELGRIEAQRAAQAAWQAAVPAVSHEYLTRKGITVQGLRIATADLRWRLLGEDGWRERRAVRGGDLLVPMRDQDGGLVSLQRINCDGKFFLPGARASGLHFRIDGGPRVVLAEGLATAASWHAATGDTVLVAFSAGNLAHVAAYAGADLVAADNDISGAGERAAKATGLPFLMPPTVGHDWNDEVLEFGPGELLAALADIPVFDKCPAKAERIELKGRQTSWLNRLGSAATPEDAALLAWSLGLKLVAGVPVQRSLDGLVRDLRVRAPAGLVRPETFAAIREHLARLCEWRQRRALSSIGLSPAGARRHRVERHETLPTLAPDDYRGVILLKAPMGSGKTQLVGRPFSNWARGQGGVFLALCHRRSLVRELARRLGTEHYQEITADVAFSVRRLATCLPSLVKDAHQQIVGGVRYLFIDEIAQVLRSLDAHVTVASGKSKSELFDTLRQVVRQAECVIGADAGLDGRVVAFLESCRPGERFRIIDVPHADQGRRVQFGFGQDALASAYGEALARLAAGERLWIGCGEQSRAVEVARVLATAGRRILLLHGHNTGDPASAAFYADPEGESLKYDAVIHTSVISSGISIEHRGRPHFDHGVFIGTGITVGPADAMQMMARVRYLRTWTVVATASSKSGIQDADAILSGATAAAQLEGLTGDVSELDRFVAGIRADDAMARADFAAGLWWCLRAQSFIVSQMSAPGDGSGVGDLRDLRAELRAERVRRILDAGVIDSREFERLSRAGSITQADSDKLTRYLASASMGMPELDADVVEMWDGGRGPVRMDRFSAATAGLAEVTDTPGDDLLQKRLTRARAAAYGLLFDGIDLRPGLRVTPALADTIMRRVLEHRLLLSYLQIVPAKYAAKPGSDLLPPAYPMREVGEILARMGLETKRRDGGFTPTSGNSFNTESGYVGAAEARRERSRFYEISAESWHRMSLWCERRNAGRRLQAVTVPDWQAMAFGVDAAVPERVGCAVKSEKSMPQWAKPSFRVVHYALQPPEAAPEPPRPWAWEKPAFTIRAFAEAPPDRLLARCLALWGNRPPSGPPKWRRPRFRVIPLARRPAWQRESGVMPHRVALALDSPAPA